MTRSFARRFRAAAAADPAFAMAWWGVALVNGPHIDFPAVPPEAAREARAARNRARPDARRRRQSAGTGPHPRPREAILPSRSDPPTNPNLMPHTLGAVLMRAGRYADAAEVYEADRAKYPEGSLLERAGLRGLRAR